MSERKQFTNDQKANIIWRLKNREKNDYVANKLGIGHTTKHMEKLRKKFQNERFARKKLHSSNYFDMDNILLS